MEMSVSHSVVNHPLNHTGTYFYAQGQILIHLRLEYQSSAVCQTPGEYLRYYRTFRGISTKELAKRAGIVPATLKQYEARNSPIKYQTAIALGGELGIDYRLLLNEYTAFLDYPFERFLKETRAALKLTQTETAQEIGVALSTYAKWECRTRIPRRVEYRKIITAFKELGIEKDFLGK